VIRRTLTFAAACAMSAGTLVALAPVASADTCNATSDNPAVTWNICVNQSVPSPIYTQVPYLIHNCVAVCVGPYSGTVPVPTNVTDPLDVVGTVCVLDGTKWGRCLNINDDTLVGALEIGHLELSL